MPEVPAAPFVSGNRAFQYMLRAAHGAGVISLTKAYASAEAVMSAELRASLLGFAAARCGAQTFDYTGADGDDALRRVLADYFSHQGIACTGEEVLVTNGAQQALDVVARATLAPGEVLLMERPTYFGMLDLARTYRGTTLQMFWKIRFPNALPSIFAGMKVAISLSLVGTIVGEFVGSNWGLGFVIMQSQGQYNTPRVFAAILVLSVLGTLLFQIVDWVERRAMPWHVSHRHRHDDH